MPVKPKKMTYKLACLYQCWECQGEYADGKVDCEVTDCPIYPFMPYRELKPDLGILEYNPRKKLEVKWDEETREISAEHIAKMQAARKKIIKPIEIKKIVKKRKGK